jgi:hypothetical protein
MKSKEINKIFLSSKFYNKFNYYEFLLAWAFYYKFL